MKAIWLSGLGTLLCGCGNVLVPLEGSPRDVGVIQAPVVQQQQGAIRNTAIAGRPMPPTLSIDPGGSLQHRSSFLH